MTRLVCLRNAETSEAIKFSPLPRPITSGLYMRAAMIMPGHRAQTTDTAKEPFSSASARRNASKKTGSSMSERTAFSCTCRLLSFSSTRWASTSVSVSDLNLWPWAESFSLSPR